MSWTHHSLKLGSSERFTAVAITSEGILAVGQHGIVARSIDRGETFTLVAKNPSSSLQALVVDSKSGRLLATTPQGTSASLKVSIDGGALWFDAELKSKTLSHSLWGDGQGTVLRTASKPLSTYFRSVDGGVKFKKHEHEGYAARFAGDGSGRVYVATSKHVQVSTDGGATLGSPVPHGANQAFTHGVVGSNGDVWFAGASGAILRSRDP